MEGLSIAAHYLIHPSSMWRVGLKSPKVSRQQVSKTAMLHGILILGADGQLKTKSSQSAGVDSAPMEVLRTSFMQQEFWLRYDYGSYNFIEEAILG